MRAIICLDYQLSSALSPDTSDKKSGGTDIRPTPSARLLSEVRYA
ncbi:hypothetical protein PORCRE_430 [Porphyromonas crevioricanis JCM 15906]|uniref:Uncharacterized protein n=1 Tax=Porphyromonas crevioricanis JCM 15906 TaxID=1305617 RepID=S4PGL0_9PORP|nr:hypothetical protein PORCRE_430 [Porphyromonas crevioricanis JCM 15906]